MTKRELFRGEHPISTYVRRPTWKDVLVDVVVLIFVVAAFAAIIHIGAIAGF